MEDLFKIEFIDEEPFCRCDGELTDYEWSINNLGIDGEPKITDNYILHENTIYIKKEKNNFYSLLEIFGDYRVAPKYDFIANHGYGSTQASVLNEIYRDGCFIVHNVEELKNLKIKDYSKFQKDYPKFNKEKYLKFIRSLDVFYDNLKI